MVFLMVSGPPDGIAAPATRSAAMPLTDAKCRSEPPQAKLKKLVDGGGLQLWVQPSGARLWRLAYRFAGKQKLLALGVYPSVSLAKARQARDEAKRLLAQGLDPSKNASSVRKRRRTRPPSALWLTSIWPSSSGRLGLTLPSTRRSGCWRSPRLSSAMSQSRM